MTTLAHSNARTLAAALTILASPVFPSECGDTPYDCAVAEVERHEFQAAIGRVERLLATSPRNLKALNLLGIALTGAGRIDDANARFREALTIDPAFYPARKNLAVNELNRGRLAEAERHLREVLKQAPEDEITHVHLAEIHFARKRERAALPHYEKALPRLEQNPTWLLHYATSLLREGRKERALAAFQKLPENDAEGRFQAGIALGRAGAHAEAARFFAAARKGYGDPYAAGYNQVLMLVEAGDHDEAIAVAGQLSQQGLGKAELLNLVARAHLKAGRVKEAYDTLRAAASLEPASDQNYLDLAAICADHENYDLGLEVVDIGLRHRPDSLPLRLQRGVLLAHKGLLPRAEIEFEAARKLAPDNAVPYVALAMTWMETGRAPKAVEVLRERTRVAGKKGPLIPFTFGVALLRSGADPEGPPGVEAAAAFEAAIRSDPGFSAARTELGKLLLKRGDVDRAIQQLEKALQLDPTAVGAAYTLGRAYQKKGDTARAQELLSRVSAMRSGGDEPGEDAEFKRTVVRIVREGAGATPPEPAVQR